MRGPALGFMVGNVNSMFLNMEWRLGRPYQAVVVHDDTATKQRAADLWDTITSSVDWELPGRISFYSAEQIEKAPFMERAAQIDMVVVSVRDLARFFTGVSGWLSDWLNADTALPRTLVVLHERDEDRQLVGFLRTLADFSGVTMFSCDQDTSVPGIAASGSLAVAGRD